MKNIDFELLKLLRQLTEKESDRFWTRNNVFVTINAGLLAFLASSYTNLHYVIFLTLCFFGLATSLSWLQISRAGKYYAQRWRVAARQIAEAQKEIKSKAPLLAGIKNIKKPWGPTSSKCMMMMAVVTVFLWTSLLIWGFFSGLQFSKNRQTSNKNDCTEITINEIKF